MKDDSLSAQGALSKWMTEKFSELFLIHSFKEALATPFIIQNMLMTYSSNHKQVET